MNLPRTFLKIVIPIFCALLVAPSAKAAPLTRDAIILSLQKAIDRKPEAPAIPPAELNPTIESLCLLASEKADPELTRLLIHYQLAYLSPDNDLPARLIGQLFFAQPTTFYSVYGSLKPEECLRLFPYLQFGWTKAIEEKNQSLPQIKEKQKLFEKIKQSLINLRSYHADPS